jgi:hypothetical protein
MTQLLEVFNKVINKSGDTITLTYCHHNFSGTCVYKEHNIVGQNKPIRQRFYILQSADMGDVIEYMYQQGEIKDGDFNKIGSELQDYSLSLIHDHQSHLQCDDE